MDLSKQLVPLVKAKKFAYTDDYLDVANRLLDNRFIFQHVYDMEPSPIEYQLTDWQKSPNGDPEWLYVLKRQEYLQDLLFAFYYSADQKYLKKAKDFVFDWITNNYQDVNLRYNTWRTIDTGIRLLNWAPVIPVLLQNHLLTTTEWQLLQQVIQNQAEYLRQHYIDKYDLSNWGVLITTGILTLNACNPDIIAPEIVQWAVSKLTVELTVQVDENGMHWEQSPLYFIEVLRSSLCVVAAYQTALMPLPAIIIERLKRMLAALHYQVLPNGRLLQQGDTDAIPVFDLQNSADELLGQHATQVPLDFLLAEFAVPKLATDASNVTILPKHFDAVASGNYYFKDIDQQNYWHLFANKVGSGHGHASFGQIDLALEGQNILIDSGRLTYIDSPERRLLKSAAAHNVVLIDQDFATVPKDSWKFASTGTPLGNICLHHSVVDVVKTSEYLPANNGYNIRYLIWLKESACMVVLDVQHFLGKHVKTTNWILDSKIKATKVDNSNQVSLAANQTQFTLTYSAATYLKQRQLFSPRYNVAKQTDRIQLERQFTDYDVSYTVIGNQNVKNVNATNCRQADTQNQVKPEYCMAVKITLTDQSEYTLVLQHLTTIVGDKLYVVDDQPIYGELNLIDHHKVSRLL